MGKHKVGDVLAGLYKILRIYGGEGKSGRGIVYVVDDGDEIIALKTIQDQFTNDIALVNAFKREALAWVHLEKHAYIVRARYVINLNDLPYIALDYIAPDSEGRNTLTQYMKTPLSLKKALKWSIQLCYGMEYAESKGISPHRDIKPDNILIDNTGNVRITDYGLAMFLGEEKTVVNWRMKAEGGNLGMTFLRISRNEIVGGTVPWMAPEQFEGDSDIRSDIYAYGTVMYQMINDGKLPYYYNTIDDYYTAHRYEQVKKLNSKLFPIIEKCLEKEPKDRFQNFKQLRKELEKLYLNLYKKQSPAPPEESELLAGEHLNKGVSFHTLGFNDEAINEFNEALHLNPGYASAHYNLGRVYKDRKENDSAFEQFNAALRNKPGSIEYRKCVGKALEKRGDYEEAVKHYRQIVRVKPYYMEGHFDLARVYEALKNYDDAITLYQNFIEFTPSKDPTYTSKIKEAKQKLKQLKKIQKIKKKREKKKN